MKKVSLSELRGRQIVDKDGVAVDLPKKPELPKPRELDPAEVMAAGVAKMAEQMRAAIQESTRAANACAAAAEKVAAGQLQVAAAVALERPEPKRAKRWSIKVRREDNLIVDMTATPEY